MNARLSAGDRLERLLAIVPWVASHDGPLISDVAERFDYPEGRLVADLTETLWMVGVYPFTPDQLIDVLIEDGRVWIHYADYFERPLRLSSEQALLLMAAGSSVLSGPGADPDGPLGRGLKKISASLGMDTTPTMEVELGSLSPEIMATARQAVAGSTQLDLDYYAYGRDEITERRVEPLRVSSDGGNWYLLAYCHRAHGRRLFRMDRIRDARGTDVPFEAPDELPEVSVFQAAPDDPRVTLRVAPEAAWVATFYPAEDVVELPTGWLQVTLAVSALRWLERLVLRLGPDGILEDVPAEFPADLGRHAAQRILKRYNAG